MIKLSLQTEFIRQNTARLAVAAVRDKQQESSADYDMLKKEVAQFKSDILSQYKAHIELISKLPDIADEEAKKKKDKLTDITLKYALNGLSGNLQNEYSWCYDPYAVMKIRINGQLLLLMLSIQKK